MCSRSRWETASCPVALASCRLCSSSGRLRGKAATSELSCWQECGVDLSCHIQVIANPTWLPHTRGHNTLGRSDLLTSVYCGPADPQPKPLQPHFVCHTHVISALLGRSMCNLCMYANDGLWPHLGLSCDSASMAACDACRAFAWGCVITPLPLSSAGAEGPV